MSRQKSHIKAGDQVEVIAGNNRGKTGAVVEVNLGKEQVVVEGIRKIKKAVRRSDQNPNGGIVEKDGPIHISNVRKVT